jgi:hypothetical protein
MTQPGLFLYQIIDFPRADKRRKKIKRLECFASLAFPYDEICLIFRSVDSLPFEVMISDSNSNASTNGSNSGSHGIGNNLLSHLARVHLIRQIVLIQAFTCFTFAHVCFDIHR